jgi:hypothetical protein
VCGSHAGAGWRNRHHASSNIIRAARMTTSERCRRAHTTSAVTRAAATMQGAMDSVVSTAPAAFDHPRGQTSRQRTSGSGNCGTRSWCGTRSATVAIASPRQCSTTASRTVAILICSGTNATGKDCASRVTASRPHTSCGVRGGGRSTMRPGLEIFAAPGLNFDAPAPMLRPASETSGKTGRSRFLPLSTFRRSDGQAGRSGSHPASAPARRCCRASAEARGMSKTFSERRKCARRYYFCVRSSRFGGPSLPVALQEFAQDAS